MHPSLLESLSTSPCYHRTRARLNKDLPLGKAVDPRSEVFWHWDIGNGNIYHSLRPLDIFLSSSALIFNSFFVLFIGEDAFTYSSTGKCLLDLS